jgi:hypothetical protein
VVQSFANQQIQEQGRKKMNIKKSMGIFLTLLIVLTFAVPTVLAGSPHFVGKTSIERSGDDLVVSGKEAGLGNETSVHILITAEAQCINPGNNHPQAGNKETFAAEGDFPIQNGKALFSLTLEAAFQPDCSPPMTVEWTNVVVRDDAHGVSATFPGPF